MFIVVDESLLEMKRKRSEDPIGDAIEGVTGVPPTESIEKTNEDDVGESAGDVITAEARINSSIEGVNIEADTGAVAMIGEGDSDSEFSSEMLRITIIDKEQKPKKFNVHKSLICDRSPYFAAIKNFDESRKNHAVLNDIDHDAFRQIVHWVYAGSIRQDDDLHDTCTLIRVVVAAGRLMMGKCTNVAMGELRAEFMTMNESVTMNVVLFVNTFDLSVDSELVQFVLDHYAYENMNDDWTYCDLTEVGKLRKETGAALLTKFWDLAQQWRRAFSDRREKPTNPARIVGCCYHSHLPNESCYFEGK